MIPTVINAQPERLREAIPYLPEHAEVGYLSDRSFEAASGSAAYFGVMYALAPRLVTRSADSHEWVVGNFSHPLDLRCRRRCAPPELVKDFGNGIVLFCRRRPVISIVSLVIASLIGYCGVRLWLHADASRSPWTQALHAALGIGLERVSPGVCTGCW